MNLESLHDVLELAERAIEAKRDGRWHEEGGGHAPDTNEPVGGSHIAEWMEGMDDAAEAIRALKQQHADRKLVAEGMVQVEVAELARLHDIEHYCWHVLDDSEEDAQTGVISFEQTDDYKRLSEALPEGHPAAGGEEA